MSQSRPPPGPTPRAGTGGNAPSAPSAPARAVQRAVAELRRGTPVLLRGSGVTLAVVSAETAGARGIAELAELAAGPPILLLAPVRAAAILRRPVKPDLPAVGLAVPKALFSPAVLHGIADPTEEQLLKEPPEQMPAPHGAGAALALAKIGRLLPAILAAEVTPETEAALAPGRFMTASVTDVLAHPAANAGALRRVAEVVVPLEDVAEARIVAFRSPEDASEHLAIVIGAPETRDAPLVRVHSECFTGDLLGSLRCDCGPQLRGAIRRMAQDGAGVLLYLAQEGRGIGLVNKLRAYALQDRGLDTLDANRALGWGADERDFMVAAMMLASLGIGRVRLLTNNPDKVKALAACGVDVAARIGHVIAPNGVNDGYLDTKARRFGHLLG